jgi:hypothetical protein
VGNSNILKTKDDYSEKFTKIVKMFEVKFLFWPMDPTLIPIVQ